MLKIRTRLASLLIGPLLGLLAAMPSAQAQSEAGFAAHIGATPIQLPLPYGFSEPTGGAPALRNLGETMTPATNRLLAMFVADTDMVRVKAGQQPSMERYFMVQTFRPAEESTLSPSDFGEVQVMLRQQYGELFKNVTGSVQGELDNAARKLGKDLGAQDLKLKVGEVTPQEIFHDVPGQISLLALTVYQIQVADKTIEAPMVLGMSTLNLKGKLVYFYAYSRYRNAADLEWVKAQTREWLRRTGG